MTAGVGFACYLFARVSAEARGRVAYAVCMLPVLMLACIMHVCVLLRCVVGAVGEGCSWQCKEQQHSLSKGLH